VQQLGIWRFVPEPAGKGIGEKDVYGFQDPKIETELPFLKSKLSDRKLSRSAVRKWEGGACTKGSLCGVLYSEKGKDRT
jgi:hypothetical protein